MLRTRILITVLFLVVSHGLKAQSAQAVNLRLPTVIFTDPESFENGNKDQALLDQISSMIHATPRGEEITVCVFKFELEDLAQELIKAQSREVKVRVILNKGDTSKETNKEVKDILQTELKDFHYIENDITDKGIIHNKFILFSRIETTHGPINNVILQTSSNFQKKGAKKLQDMVIMASYELYFCFLDFWHEIKVLGRAGQLDHYDYFNCSDGNSQQAYFFPKRRDKEEFGKDEVLKLLEGIKQPQRTEIRFAHGKWDDNRDDIVDEIEKLQEDGALVEVITNNNVDKEVKEEFKDLDRGIYYLEEDYNMHTKFFLLKQGESKQVWTGSHNLTDRSLRENFEVLLKIENDEVYDQYLEYFDQIKSLANHK